MDSTTARRKSQARLGEAAEKYARKGWPVFPLSPRSKVPLKGSHGFKDATTDPEQIRQWWAENPDANIALATGRGIVVVDVDTRNGGDETLRNLIEKVGEGFTHTRQALTGGGGLHLYYRVNGQRLRSVDGLLPGIDLKAERGAVVLPPSVHESGEPYKWDNGLPIVGLPEWIPELVSGPAAPDNTIPEGYRNTKLTSEAGQLRARGADVEQIREHIHHINAARCDPPVDDREVEGIARSVASYPRQFNRTDLGNAERFAARHAADIRFVKAWGWVVWDGRRWQVDARGEVERRAAETVRAMLAEAATVHDPDERKQLSRFAIKSESRAAIANMLALAESQRELRTDETVFDQHPELLTVQNGVIDLSTGAVREARREDMITRRTDIRYDPDADCPRWIRFLDEIFEGRPAVIEFVRRAVGYSMTGLTTEQCLFVLWGAGSNGKSTFVRVIEGLLGELALETPPETLLLRRDGIPNDVARLAGARFVSARETDEGRRLAESRIKQMTGGDRVAARFLHKEWFDFTPTFKIWLATNHRPEIRGTDHAIWRRIRLIPFNVIIPDDRQDGQLPDKLAAELPGILNWAVRGCLEWQRDGLRPPDEVMRATAQYRADEDVLGAFFAEHTVQKGQCPASSLYAEYRKWAEASGEKLMSQTRFGKAVAERGHLRVYVGERRNITAYQGISLRPPEDLHGLKPKFPRQFNPGKSTIPDSSPRKTGFSNFSSPSARNPEKGSGTIGTIGDSGGASVSDDGNGRGPGGDPRGDWRARFRQARLRSRIRQVMQEFSARRQEVP
jgi:putative DNA primase/helicase